MADLGPGDLRKLQDKALWLSAWMIHNANHLRPKADGLKVGGHQASCASMVSLMTALYGRVLRPQDRVAVKPHAGPVFHALQYLAGKQSLDKMQRFRGFGGVQSYLSRTKDTADVDFSTGSVGLGVAITAFASLVQDYVRARGWGRLPQGRMVALVGDAELDEGNIYECCKRAGNTACAIAGGSSTTTAKAWTAWCARDFRHESPASSRPSAGMW